MIAFLSGEDIALTTSMVDVDDHDVWFVGDFHESFLEAEDAKFFLRLLAFAFLFGLGLSPLFVFLCRLGLGGLGLHLICR
mgnify:CR=1 FL=1